MDNDRVLAELNLHLEQMSNNIHGLVQVVTIMQQELKERFDYITNPKATQFDTLFVICKFLNPAYQLKLS